MERTYNLNIPSGLSPPDFSAIKMNQEEDECNEHPHKNDYMVEMHPSWMSPFLNLSSPNRRMFDEKPIIPVAKKLNFNE